MRTAICWCLVLTVSLCHEHGAVAQEAGDTEGKLPELVAMAWGAADDTPEIEDIEFFGPDSRPIESVALIGELTSLLKLEQFQPKLNREVDHLRPLILIFRLPEYSEVSQVSAILNKSDDDRLLGFPSKPGENSNLVASAIVPLTETHPRWADEVELSVRFSREPKTKTLDKDFAARQEIMEGVWAGFMRRGPSLNFTFENEFESTTYPTRMLEYSVELEDGQIEKPNDIFIKQMGDHRLLCWSTKPLQPDDVKSISVTESLFAYEPIGKIRIPKEYLDDK